MREKGAGNICNMPKHQQNSADLNDLLTDQPIGAYMFEAARSDEAQELIGRAPSWLILWGNTLYLGLLLLLIFIGWLVKYPDLVKANLRILATNAPNPYWLEAMDCWKNCL
jgi:hypothetical protein